MKTGDQSDFAYPNLICAADERIFFNPNLPSQTGMVTDHEREWSVLPKRGPWSSSPALCKPLEQKIARIIKTARLGAVWKANGNPRIMIFEQQRRIKCAACISVEGHLPAYFSLSLNSEESFRSFAKFYVLTSLPETAVSPGLHSKFPLTSHPGVTSPGSF